jgi:hypothetical protein
MDFGVFVLEGLRFLLLSVFLIGVGFAPAIFLVWRHLRLLRDPSNLLRYGVIVRRFEALDNVAETIGRYRDSDIYRYVTFKGMRYEFERVVPLPRLFQIGPNELFVEPGIVYLTRP